MKRIVTPKAFFDGKTQVLGSLKDFFNLTNTIHKIKEVFKGNCGQFLHLLGTAQTKGYIVNP